MSEHEDPLYIDPKALEPLVKKYYDQIQTEVLEWSKNFDKVNRPTEFIDGLILKINYECGKIQKEHPEHSLVIATIAKCYEKMLLTAMKKTTSMNLPSI